MISKELAQLKATFDAHRQEWIDQGHLNEWVLLGEKDGVVGFFSAYEDVVQKAQEVFGTAMCLMQQVLVEDRTETIGRVHWGA